MATTGSDSVQISYNVTIFVTFRDYYTFYNTWHISLTCPDYSCAASVKSLGACTWICFHRLYTKFCIADKVVCLHNCCFIKLEALFPTGQPS